MRGPFSVAALFVSVLSAQTADQMPAQTIPFVNIEDPSSIQELVNALRTIPDLGDVSVDASRRAFTVRGTSGQVALAQWLVQQLDRPAGWQAPEQPAAYDYHPPAGKDVANTAVRVFYLTQMRFPSELQEVQNIIRTGAEINRVTPFTVLKVLVARGTPESVAFTEWLVQQLNQPAQPGRKTASYDYVSPEGGISALARAVRVVYLANTPTPRGLQEMQNVMRTGSDINRVFPFTSRMALVVRGEPERVALGEWFIQQLDQPATPGRQTAAYVFQSLDYTGGAAMDSAVRVNYLDHLDSPGAIQDLMIKVRIEAHVNRMFYCSTPRALALRGSATEIALAEQLIADADKPAGQ